ncbi:UNKNOWN [Stylonychia lemnae]|uniref:Uncharacterized protein n=1 Tax=Stylonychia lemnae TaxID=5949 RepID=A0A078BCB7_STYLE|nr:UNKNOWN [Stylonychia lemnae]|eukprot:CDW91243.1 UNKNOWN [Stylonychia lemnae]
MRKQSVNQQDEILKLYASKFSTQAKPGERPQSQIRPNTITKDKIKYDSTRAVTNQGYQSKDQMTTEGKDRHKEIQKLTAQTAHHQSQPLLRPATAYHDQSKQLQQSSSQLLHARPQTALTSSRIVKNTSRRDHLQELFEKLHFNYKQISTYKDIYAFKDEHKKDVMDHDFQYHYKRDRVTIYNEAMVRMKPHLRK